MVGAGGEEEKRSGSGSGRLTGELLVTTSSQRQSTKSHPKVNQQQSKWHAKIIQFYKISPHHFMKKPWIVSSGIPNSGQLLGANNRPIIKFFGTARQRTHTPSPSSSNRVRAFKFNASDFSASETKPVYMEIMAADNPKCLHNVSNLLRSPDSRHSLPPLFSEKPSAANPNSRCRTLVSKSKDTNRYKYKEFQTNPKTQIHTNLNCWCRTLVNLAWREKTQKI